MERDTLSDRTPVRLRDTRHLPIVSGKLQICGPPVGKVLIDGKWVDSYASRGTSRRVADTRCKDVEFAISEVLDELRATPEGSMQVRIKTVTPIDGEDVLIGIETQRFAYDHVCLELDHWGYEEALAWSQRVKDTGDNSVVLPGISVHGADNQLTYDEVERLMSAGALWIPRSDCTHKGKDGVTIMEELFRLSPEAENAAVGPPRRLREEDPDLADYRDLACGYSYGDDEDEASSFATQQDLDEVFSRLINAEVDKQNAATQAKAYE